MSWTIAAAMSVNPVGLPANSRVTPPAAIVFGTLLSTDYYADTT